jgi:hypothetical protein
MPHDRQVRFTPNSAFAIFSTHTVNAGQLYQSLFCYHPIHRQQALTAYFDIWHDKNKPIAI